MRGNYLRWGTALSLALVCVLVLTGGAGARTVTNTDPVGDAFGGAPDIQSVMVDDTTFPGYFRIYVETSTNQVYKDIPVGDQLIVYIDIDRNTTDGYEYAFRIVGTNSGPTCDESQWNGSEYTQIRDFGACDYNFGVVFVFPPSWIGSPRDFQFAAESFYGSPATGGDSAPDSGSWLFDDTPPDTNITSSPNSSTSTDATFSFTSTEAGSTFQCSLDGVAFASCSNPAVYHNLSLGSHNFQVRATDSSMNTDPSPASVSWTVLDGTPPTATASSGSCCDAKGRALVAYTLGDNSGQAAATVTIVHRPGGKPVGTPCSFQSGAAGPTRYADAPCLVPPSARGWLRFCVQAADQAMPPNRSPASCKPLTFKKLNAQLAVSARSLSNRSLRVASFTLTGLPPKGKARISCHGCKLTSARDPVGTKMPPGSSLEVRVVKSRFRGTFIQKTNVHGTRIATKIACLPPGELGPVISCRKTHN